MALTEKDILTRVVSIEGVDTSTMTPEEIHDLGIKVELVKELSELVAFYTGSNEPTKPLARHLESRFKGLGVSEQNIKVIDYTSSTPPSYESIDDIANQETTSEQSNIALQFEPRQPYEETVVISGHLDVTGENIKNNYCYISKEEAERDKKIGGRSATEIELKLREKTEGEVDIYGVGTADMKNIFAVILQLFKERKAFESPPDYMNGKKWLIGALDKQTGEQYTAWLEGRLKDDKWKTERDFLRNQKNRLVLIGTAGEEQAGHDGMKKILEADPFGIKKDMHLWLVPEIAGGMKDTHLGYAATVSVFEDEIAINGINYNPLEQALLSAVKLRGAHASRKLVEPYDIRDDRLRYPTMSVGILRGRGKERAEWKSVSIRASLIDPKKYNLHSSHEREVENVIEGVGLIYRSLKKMYGNKIRLSSADGGEKRNNIPTSVGITIQIDPSSYDDVLLRRIVDRAVQLKDDGFSHMEYSIGIDPIGIEGDLDFTSKRGDLWGPFDYKGDVGIEINVLRRRKSPVDKYTVNKEEVALVVNDYRLVPRQTPNGLEEGVKGVLSIFNPKVKLVRDSYPLVSRLEDLEKTCRDGLLRRIQIAKENLGWGSKAQEEAGTEQISTEAGTVANICDGIVPLLYSIVQTDGHNTHSGIHEHMSLKELFEQYRLFSDTIPFSVSHQIGRTMTDEASTLLSLGKRSWSARYIRETEYAGHLAWFREVQDSGKPFAVISVDVANMKKRVADSNLPREEIFVNELAYMQRFLRLYPIVVVQADQKGKHPVLDEKQLFYDVIRLEEGITLPASARTQITRNMKGGKISVIPAFSYQNGRRLSPFEVSSYLVKHLDALKFVTLRESEVCDIEGLPISWISQLRDYFPNGVYERRGDYKNNPQQPIIDRAYDKLLQGIYGHLSGLEPKHTVQVTRVEALFRELFTQGGDGTFIRLGYNITESGVSLADVKREDVKRFISEMYEDRKLIPDFFEKMSKVDGLDIIMEKSGKGIIIAEPIAGVKGVKYIGLIGIDKEYIGQHLAEAMMTSAIKKYGKVVMREWSDSPLRPTLLQMLQDIQRKGVVTSVESTNISTCGKSRTNYDFYCVGFDPLILADQHQKSLALAYALNRPVIFKEGE